MSIASRITSIEGHIEEDYNALERLGADLSNVDKNIENIASVVNDIYDKLPKVTGTGSDLSLTPTLKGGMQILPLGNAEQDGTPTPTNPIDVKVVTGDNQVVVSNSDNTQTQSTTLHLGSLELCKIGDYQDVITGSKDNWKVVRKVGKVNLAIADMNNSENYPGWKGVSQLVNDLNLTSSNVRLSNVTSLLTNIGANYLYANANADGTFWIDRASFGNDYTQTYWKTNFPNLVFKMYYGILATPTEETITDTSVIQSLNELNDLMSYDGTTNIVITSNSANAQLTAQISALKGE